MLSQYVTLRTHCTINLILEVSEAKLIFYIYISEFRGMGWKGEFKRIAVLIGSVWTIM